MIPSEEGKIREELRRMIPGFDNMDYDEQYSLCLKVYNELSNFEDYTLIELVDPITFETKWFWRRKS